MAEANSNQMKNIIFLHTGSTISLEEGWKKGFSVELMDNLNDIIGESGAKVVILDPPKDAKLFMVKMILKAGGFRHEDSIIGLCRNPEEVHAAYHYGNSTFNRNVTWGNIIDHWVSEFLCKPYQRENIDDPRIYEMWDTSVDPPKFIGMQEEEHLIDFKYIILGKVSGLFTFQKNYTMYVDSNTIPEYIKNTVLEKFK